MAKNIVDTDITVKKEEVTRTYPNGIVNVRGVEGKKSKFIALALQDFQQVYPNITENDIKVTETKYEIIVTAYV